MVVVTEMYITEEAQVKCGDGGYGKSCAGAEKIEEAQVQYIWR